MSKGFFFARASLHNVVSSLMAEKMGTKIQKKRRKK